MFATRTPSIREKLITPLKLITMTGLIGLAAVQCSGTAGETIAANQSGAVGNISGTQGTLVSADGSPLAGAAVVLSRTSSQAALTRSSGSRLENANGQFVPLFSMTDGGGDVCDDITDGIDGAVIAADCTNAEGLYEISGEIPCGEEITFTAKKGSFMLSVNMTLSCAGENQVATLDDIAFDDDCAANENSGATALVSESPASTINQASCDFNSARMAVVTGYYDEIQNVLAKLGFGSVDEFGRLDTALPFDFDLVDGNNSLPDDYEDFIDLVSDPERLATYDIIFINCGNAEELSATDPAIKANLQAFVANGGKLYVTDWSYGFIEQPFPGFMNFLDGGEDAEIAENHGDAKQGAGGISVDANVNNDVLAAWLDSVTVNDGTIEEDCFFADAERINGRLGARNEDGSVTIADFLAAWVAMQGEHEDHEGESNIWISGNVETASGPVADSPLTVTRDHEEGRLLYSSYHTAHSCPTTGFWPQERLLQYLVFEL